MRLKKKRKGQSSLHLTDKRHPLTGILAACLGVISIVGFLLLCFLSSESHGHAGAAVGLAGLGCFAVSLAGFALSWISLRQENIRPVFPTIAAIINGLAVVFYSVLYILGNLIL